MNPIIDKFYDDIEVLGEDSATARASKIRKWLLIVSGMVYLLKTDHFLIQKIDIPYVELKFPEKALMLTWTTYLLYYLILIFTINLISVLYSEIKIRIKFAHQKIEKTLFEESLKEIQIHRERFEKLLLERRELEARLDQKNKTTKRERSDSAIDQFSRKVMEPYERAILEEQVKIESGMDKVRFGSKRELILNLYPQLAIDFLRFALSFVIPFYVLHI